MATGEIDIFVYEGSVIRRHRVRTIQHVRRAAHEGLGRTTSHRRPASSWRSATVPPTADCRPCHPTRRIPADCGSTAAASAADTSDRTSSAGPGCRRQHPRLSRRTLTGSRRSSWRLPPDAPRTSRARRVPAAEDVLHVLHRRPGAPGCSSTPTSRTRRASARGMRTGCLFYEFGCRGPMTHSPCNRILMEPAVVEDPRRSPVHRLHGTGLPVRRPGEGDRVQDPEGRRRDPEGTNRPGWTAARTWRSQDCPVPWRRSGQRDMFVVWA